VCHLIRGALIPDLCDGSERSATVIVELDTARERVDYSINAARRSVVDGDVVAVAIFDLGAVVFRAHKCVTELRAVRAAQDHRCRLRQQMRGIGRLVERRRATLAQFRATTIRTNQQIRILAGFRVEVDRLNDGKTKTKTGTRKTVVVVKRNGTA